MNIISGTCVEFGPTQLPANSFRVRVRVRVRVRFRVRVRVRVMVMVRFRVKVRVTAYRKLGGPESDTSALYPSSGFLQVKC